MADKLLLSYCPVLLYTSHGFAQPSHVPKLPTRNETRARKMKEEKRCDEMMIYNKKNPPQKLVCNNM